MPKGVEHVADPNDAEDVKKVRVPVMPKGVEHGVKKLTGQRA